MSTDLEKIARRVNWYMPADQLLAEPDLFLAQVMARACEDDLIATQSQFSTEDFKRAYLRAPPGLFTKRAWAYWGLMLLGNADYSMPERFPGANHFDWRRAT